MIEMGLFPLHLIVTRFAFGAVPTAVHILDLVTSDTCYRHAPISLAGVANCTGDLLVGTLQRELGRIVIELLGARPGILAVAPFAFLAKVALMRVLGFVTIEAEARSRAKFDVGKMAFAASD